MKAISISFSFLIILIQFANATNFNNPAGGRSAALGHASVALVDFWSLQNNQAGLGFQDKLKAGVYYENRFLLEELGFKIAGLLVPTNSGTFGLILNHFGFHSYSESKVGLAYGKAFGEKVAIGIQLDYLNTHLGGEFGSTSQVTFEAGLLAKLTEKTVFGAHIFNPLQKKLTKAYNQRSPASFRFGLAYHYTDQLLVTAEAEKNSQRPVNLKAGLEYFIIEKFVIRIGFGSKPAQLSFGSGIYLKRIKIDISSSFHQVLGFSPQVSIIFRISK